MKFVAHHKPRFFAALAGILVVTFLAQCFLASRVKSPAWDEPAHIAAGLSYWSTGKMTVNLQHPPLLKELIGLSALVSGTRWPSSQQAQQLLAGNSRFEWSVGSEIITRAGADRVMFWARLPMILVGAMGAILLYVWDRRLIGEIAAVGAVFLDALDPTVVAHARHAPGRPFQFSYFGSFPPSAYGLPAGDFDPGDVKGPPPGLYVLSGHVVARTLAVMNTEGTDAGEWVRRIPPTAIVAHGLYIFDVK